MSVLTSSLSSLQNKQLSAEWPKGCLAYESITPVLWNTVMHLRVQ